MRHDANPGTLTAHGAVRWPRRPSPRFLVLVARLASGPSTPRTAGRSTSSSSSRSLPSVSPFCTCRPRLVLSAVSRASCLCLADWVLIEDFGFLGGVGTDPNSMIPMALVFVAGYVALVHAARAGAGPRCGAAPADAHSWRERCLQPDVCLSAPIAALGAIGVMLLGAAPMALASTNPNADPILAMAVEWHAQSRTTPAPPFQPCRPARTQPFADGPSRDKPSPSPSSTRSAPPTAR